MGASGELGAPGSGTVDGVNEAGGKREMELLWNEATTVASSRHVLERPRWKEATMTAPADVEDARASSRAVYSVEKGFSQRAGLMLCFFLWHVADHLLAHLMWDRERGRASLARLRPSWPNKRNART